MSARQPQPRTHLFTVRVWSEPLAPGQEEWRGKVEYVADGRTRYFRDWPSLISFLEAALDAKGEEGRP